MPTPRKGETREQFLSRRRTYDRDYERAKRPKNERGKRLYTREQLDRANARRKAKRAEKRKLPQSPPRYDYSDLETIPSWVKSVRGRMVTPQIAEWFRRGFLKTGPANEGDIIARRSFLAWMLAHKSKFPKTTPQDIARRIANQSRQTIETGAGFDWLLWREDYDMVKASR